tara:strand:+ start:310 stop:510 length:201 start_codon:yes stop_codon:yes gene_type:complete
MIKIIVNIIKIFLYYLLYMDYWLWTLLFALCGVAICKIFCICSNDYDLYQHLNENPEKLYTEPINS